MSQPMPSQEPKEDLKFGRPAIISATPVKISAELAQEKIDLRDFLAGKGHDFDGSKAPTQFILWAHTAENVGRFADSVRSAIGRMPYVRSVKVLLEATGDPKKMSGAEGLIDDFLQGKIDPEKLRQSWRVDRLHPLLMLLAIEFRKIEGETGLPVHVGLMDRTGNEIMLPKLAANVAAGLKIKAGYVLPAFYLRRRFSKPEALLFERLKTFAESLQSTANLIDPGRNASMLKNVTESRSALPDDCLMIAGMGAAHAEVGYEFEKSGRDAEVRYIGLPEELFRLLPAEERHKFPAGLKALTSLEHAKRYMPYDMEELASVCFEDLADKAVRAICRRSELRKGEFAYLRKNQWVVGPFLSAKLTEHTPIAARKAFVFFAYTRFINEAPALMGFRSFTNPIVEREILAPIAGMEPGEGQYAEFFEKLVRGLFPG